MANKTIKLAFKVTKPALALGSQTKNTVCLARGGYAYVSSVHPDLNDPQDLAAFEKDVKKFLKERPVIVAYDLHPDYQSTKYAFHLTPFALRTSPYALHPAPIQHHHAHIASCMAENSLSGQKVIGIAWDGTGIGQDGNIWGGEFLLCDYRGFERKAHLKEVSLLGGEKAVAEPYRIAWAWLFSIYKDGMRDLNITFTKNIKEKEHGFLKKILISGFNAPLTSSMGRLFDAAASLITGKRSAAFEADLAIELENAASRYFRRATHYAYKIYARNGQLVIDPAPIFKGIVSDLKAGEAKEKMAYRFHLTCADMIKKVCVILRKKERLNKVVLSGGVFQNKLLLGLASDLLYKEGFKVFTHKNLPSNDSAISLGQAVIAGVRG